MLFKLGLGLLFFLPVIESFNREFGYILLFAGSLLVTSLIWKRKDLSFDFVDMLFLFLLLFFAISTTISWSIVRSFREYTRYLAYFLIFLTFKNAPNRSSLVTYFFFPMIIVNSLVLSLLSVLYKLPIAVYLPSITGMTLFYPTFGHNRISDILIFAIPVSILLYTQAQSVTRRRLFVLFAAIFIIGLAISVSRGGLLSLSLSFLFSSYLFNFMDRAWRKFIIVFVGATILILASSFIYSNTYKQDTDFNILDGLYKPAKSEARFEYLRQAAVGFSRSPILGTGLDTFRYVSIRYQKNPFTWSWYVHNHFFELFLESGIAGGTVFLLLVSACLVLLYKTCKLDTDNYKKAIFVAILASSVHSLLDYDWHYLSILLFYFIGLSMYEYKNSYEGSFNLISQRRVLLNDTKDTILLKLIVIFIALIFMFSIYLPFDGDLEIKKAEKYLEEGNRYLAIEALEKFARIDNANSKLTKKLAEIYGGAKDRINTNFWREKTIILNPKEFGIFNY